MGRVDAAEHLCSHLDAAAPERQQGEVLEERRGRALACQQRQRLARQLQRFVELTSGRQRGAEVAERETLPAPQALAPDRRHELAAAVDRCREIAGREVDVDEVGQRRHLHLALAELPLDRQALGPGGARQVEAACLVVHDAAGRQQRPLEQRRPLRIEGGIGFGERRRGARRVAQPRVQQRLVREGQAGPHRIAELPVQHQRPLGMREQALGADGAAAAELEERVVQPRLARRRRRPVDPLQCALEPGSPFGLATEKAP